MWGKISPAIKSSFPLLAGMGMAAGSSALAVYCTIPTIGKCSACGSCLVAVCSLAGWAVVKGKDPNSIYLTSQKK